MIVPSIEDVGATADMEQLVTRLSTQLKVRSVKPPRPSPYRRDQKSISREITTDDPYEMLQSLLKSQSLIKEAVRRLRFKKEYFYSSEDDEHETVSYDEPSTSESNQEYDDRRECRPKFVFYKNN